MDLRHEVFNSLDRYFASLTATGYRSYSEVYKLLVMSFIEEILYRFPGMINEKDYKILSDILEKIYGTSCLIPYPEYKKVTRFSFKIN